MGNYRFKLSDMIPNAWFYKLRDMNNNNKTRNQNPSMNKLTPLSSTQKPRKPFYQTTESIREHNLHTYPKNPKSFDTHFPFDPPRKSSKNRTRRKTIYKPSPRKTNTFVSSTCTCQEPEYSIWSGSVHPQDHFDFHISSEHDFLSSKFEYSGSSATDIIINMEKMSYDTKKIKISEESELISELGLLPPILTKPEKQESLKNKIKPKKNSRTSSTGQAPRKSASCSKGVKVRGSSLGKIANKETRGRKSVKEEKKGVFYSESFAIVKASLDPEQDFKDSMMEMIVENNIKTSKELEDLLACYLALNSNQYHHMIIKTFEFIWFNMPQN